MAVWDANGDNVTGEYGGHRVQLCPVASPGDSCTTVAGTGVGGSSAVQLNRRTRVPKRAEDAITALLHDDAEGFFQMFSNLSSPSDRMVQELLAVAEYLLGHESAVVEARLKVEEDKSFETPGATVLQVMTPSDNRVANGFALGGFTIPPLDDEQYRNISVHVISCATNLFDVQDISNTMLTISVQKNRATLALLFTLAVNERIASGTDAVDRGCMFWSNSGCKSFVPT